MEFFYIQQHLKEKICITSFGCVFLFICLENESERKGRALRIQHAQWKNTTLLDIHLFTEEISIFIQDCN